MFRHVVLITWKPDATEAQKGSVAGELGKLPGVIDVIRGYRFGHDIGVNTGNFDFVVVADFADAEDYIAYRDHPLHRALVAERIAPHVAERAAVQFDAD